LIGDVQQPYEFFKSLIASVIGRQKLVLDTSRRIKLRQPVWKFAFFDETQENG